LRQAITDANNNPGADTIVFNIPGSPPFSIAPTTGLPVVTEALTIDATTQPGYSTRPVVELSGALAGTNVNGLVIVAGPSRVRGLAVNRFSANGILVQDTDNVRVEGNFVGTSVYGTNSLPNGLAGIGIVDAKDNVVGGTGAGLRNVVSGFNRVGVYISGNKASNNVVAGNYIGTDLTGTRALGAQSNGVLIAEAPFNTVGGASAAARNVISANGQSGVYLFGPGATGNQILGNYIGTDVTGTQALGNNSDGVTIWSASGNLVAGANVLAGNLNYGAFISGYATSNATANQVRGNFIGTTPSGTVALPNGYSGVGIGSVSGNLVGGTVPEARNLISGNNQSGVLIFGASASNNVVQGNFIGVAVSGSVALSNKFDGVGILSAGANLVGGAVAGAGNLISGNGLFGVYVEGASLPGNAVQGNLIGTDVTGQAKLGNGESGIGIYGAPGNLIGGTTASARNLISGNAELGVYLTNSAGNTIQGNFVGTDISGTRVLGNGFEGMIVSDSPDNLVGGLTAGARNLISGNGDSGMQIYGVRSVRNLVYGNFIGTDVTGNFSVYNRLDGVTIFDGISNVVGAAVLGAANLISGNSDSGVTIMGNSAKYNTVRGNFIGVRPDGVTRLDNRLHGVQIGRENANPPASSSTVSSSNTIGGFLLGEANIIANNQTTGYDGIRIKGGTGNDLRGNSIYGHAGLGIDLGLDGVTINDGGNDSDTGPNNLQNYPVLLGANNISTSTVIVGNLNSAKSRTYRIDFFASPVCGGTGYGEGKTHIASITRTTSGTGFVQFTNTVPFAVPTNHYISAIATEIPSGNSSEFSACVRVIGGGPINADLKITKVVSTNVVALGSNVTYHVIVQNLGPSTAYDVRVSEALPPTLSFVSASPTPVSLFANVLTFNLGILSNGASAVVTIVANVSSPGGLTNVAAVTSAVPDPNPGDNTAAATIVAGGPKLIIQRSGGQAFVYWPTNYYMFRLETTTNLNPVIVWTAATNTPVIVGGQFRVPVNLSELMRFFRMVYP
jgi:titin